MRPVHLASVVLGFSAVAGASAACAEESVDYVRHIKPLLAQRCVSCHGPLKQEGGLRVDAVALLKKGGDAGPAVVPGDVGKSLIVDALAGANGLERMPKDGAPLTAAEIALIRDWIAAGAPSPADEVVAASPADHWAYKVPVRPPVPMVKNSAWVRTPVDAFIAAEHEKRGLVPTAEAPKHVLLRRVHLDLTGLPPTTDELRAFLADDSPQAYERVVERLLDSPQYGERWGRHWMDVWRYSDWYGYGAELRNSSRHIWRWRDWIVDSLNADKPYDRMILEMLAADELDPGNVESLRATGFLTRQYFKFNRNIWLENTVEHTSKAFLGLTLNCARCHEHKYDPISQEEFYKFRAIFEPYQVRTDRMLDANLEKEGLDLAYDAAPKAETFVFDRGNEATPLKDKPIPPAVPAILGRVPFAVAPVPLPAAQYYPASRPEAQRGLSEEAETRVTAALVEKTRAEGALAAARKGLAEVKERIAGIVAVAEIPGEPTPAAPPAPPPFLADDFAAANPALWKTGLGQWRYEKGRLTQSDPAAAFRAIETTNIHPRDVTITVKYRTTGGGQYKSVGVSFDQSAEGTFDAVYTSVGGGKIQAMHSRGGGMTYPPNGAKPITLAVGAESTLRLDLRDTLLNVTLDGQFQFAYRLAERRDGKLALWTYDATAEFVSIRVEPLAQTASLMEPAAAGSAIPLPTPPVLTLAMAEAAVADAELASRLTAKRHEAAVLARDSVGARIAADKARYATPPDINAAALSRAAVTIQRNETVATAEAGAIQAELDHAKAMRAAAADSKKAAAADEAKKKLDAARAALTAAVAAREKPVDENYTPLGPVYPTESTGRRLALARWIADPNNPLTARVAVNHVWLRHFGQPLVPTVFDFGLNGKPPTHPALLDWLACEFSAGAGEDARGEVGETGSGGVQNLNPAPDAANAPSPLAGSRSSDRAWTFKRIHKLMLLSSAYRMDSVATPQAGALTPSTLNPRPLTLDPSATDPDNRWHWRMNARRMEAEAVRDSVLAVAGNLDPTPGGPELDEKLGLTTARRSLYYRHAPEKFMTFLEVFDSANTTECYRRVETVVPQQALALVNSQLALEQSRRFAAGLVDEMHREPASGDASAQERPSSAGVVEDVFVSRAFERILCRQPTGDELAACREFLSSQAARLTNTQSLTAFNTGAAPAVKASADPKQRARENLIHVLLNHTEFVTIR